MSLEESLSEALLLSPQTTGGFLSCILGLVLPLAYGFQPDMVLMALGPAHGLQNAQAALLAAVLRGPAGGRILAVVEEVNWARWISCTGGRWIETIVSLPSLPQPLNPWARNPYSSLQGPWHRYCMEKHLPGWALS